MRLVFSKAILPVLRKSDYQRLYVNIARMRYHGGRNGAWQLCWESKYLGATRLCDAQRLRALWLVELRGRHPRSGKPMRPFWNEHTVRTIRVI